MSAEPLEQALIPALPRPSLLVLRHPRLPPHALQLTSPPSLAIHPTSSLAPAHAPPGLCSHGVRRVRLLHRRCRRRPCLLQVTPSSSAPRLNSPQCGFPRWLFCIAGLLNFVNLLLRRVCMGFGLLVGGLWCWAVGCYGLVACMGM